MSFPYTDVNKDLQWNSKLQVVELDAPKLPGVVIINEPSNPRHATSHEFTIV